MQRKTMSFIIPAIIISYSLQFSDGKVFLNETPSAFSIDYCQERRNGYWECIFNENRECTPTTTYPYYNCTDCLPGSIERHGNCIDYCQEGEDGYRDCIVGQKRKCTPTTTDPFYKCTDCLSDLIEKDGKCIDGCKEILESKDMTWNDACQSLNADCVPNVNETAVTCQCKDQSLLFNPEDFLCKDHCQKGEDGYRDCSEGKKRICTPTTTDPFYKCTNCLSDLIEKDGKCIDPCEENNREWIRKCEGIGATCKLNTYKNDSTCQCKYKEDVYIPDEHVCKDVCAELGGKKCEEEQHMKCHPAETHPFYKCEECLAGFKPAGDKCIDHCQEGEDGYRDCSEGQKRKCTPTATDPFYKCTDCLSYLIEKDAKCVGYCDNRTKTKEECDRRNRICRSLEEYPFYECEECKDGYIEDGHICSDYCALGKEGKRLCNETHRTCEPLRISPFFLCKECQSGFEENKNGCIRVCERNSTSGIKCKEMKRNCEYTSDYPFYHCGDCEKGLLEFEGLCVQRKTVNEINPLQLLLMKSSKTTEEKQVLLYKPQENHSLFELSSLLDLK